MTIQEQKKKIRQQIRSDIKRAETNACGEKAALFLASLRQYCEAETVLSYLPLGDEISTEAIHNTVLRDGKKLALPRIIGNTMDYYFLDSEKPLSAQIEKGDYGIWEPAENLKKLSITDIDASFFIIFPGRAFTKDGRRLGRGKGFYDSYFKPFSNELKEAKPFFAGLCYEVQILDELPSEEHDIGMDCVITDQQILFC